jgi:uncharacterized SAM-binding protein YcdF (DUF218 family)
MRRTVKAGLIVAILFVAWVVTAPLLASYLIVEKPLEHADAIIVLSGSAVYKERTQRAAELYRLGVAPRIFITNDGERAGWSVSEQTNQRFVELEQRELIAHGVLPDAITVLPGEVAGTDQEAKVLGAELDARPIKSLLIITSAYHTRRALRTFERILAGKDIEIGIAHPLTGERTPRPTTWWLSLRGWQMVAGEYVKAVVYDLYY